MGNSTVSHCWLPVLGNINGQFFQNHRWLITPEPGAGRSRCPIWVAVECVGCFRFIFFGPARSIPAKHGEEKYFGFHSSQPTHPTPSFISCGLSVDGSRKDGERNAKFLDSGHSRGFTQTAGMCPGCVKTIVEK